MIKIIATVQGGVIQDLEAHDEQGNPIDSETEIIDMDMDGYEDEEDEPWEREKRDDAEGNWLGY